MSVVGIASGAGGGNSQGLAGVSQAVMPAHLPNKADARFRSFAERYVIARANFFRVDQAGHDADLWECMLNAKRAYSMVRRMSQHLDPEDL